VRPPAKPARAAALPGGGARTLISVISLALAFATVIPVPSWTVANDSSVITRDAPPAVTVTVPLSVNR
jgi:hypothetical protein